eukprot:10339301-Alexandrium_andersonii.AAC.1
MPTSAIARDQAQSLPTAQDGLTRQGVDPDADAPASHQNVLAWAHAKLAAGVVENMLHRR